MGRHALSDADWARVEPLLPARGFAGDRRRFVDGVVHVARTGCPWRDLPAEFGNGNTAWRRFSRWAKSGVWGRVLDALRDRDDATLVLDSTVVRAHAHAAGASERAARRPSAAAAAGSARRSTRP